MIISKLTSLLFLFFINLIFFLNFKSIKLFINIYDYPNKKLKLHQYKTPILGGIILFYNYFLLLLFNLIFGEDFIFNFNTSREIISLVFLIFSLFFVGLYDDKYFISATSKFLITSFIIIVTICINENLILERVLLSFYNKNIFLNQFAFIFSILCFLLLINALNFYDGINGQSIINFSVIFLYLYYKSNYNIFYLQSILILSFLFYLNIKNKTFLGDGGIYLLSSLIGFCLIYEFNINKSFLYADEIFLILMLPGLDLLRLTVSRICKGKNAFLGDREHLHHLIFKKYSLYKTNLFLLIMILLPIFALHFLNLPIIYCSLFGIFNYFFVFVLVKKKQ